MRIYLLLGTIVAATVLAVACYNPTTKNGAFQCSADFGNVCPSGFTCSGGLCIKPEALDLALAPLDLQGDQAVVPFVPTCDDFVGNGSFANMTALTSLNTTADEQHLALDTSDSMAWRLVYTSGGNVLTATLGASDHKMVGTPTAVIINGPSGASGTYQGGSFTNDGNLWFTATTAGATSLYSATSSGAIFTATAATQPASMPCTLSDPFFFHGTAANDLGVAIEMYAAYPLSSSGGTCSSTSWAVLGAENRNIGGFVSAIPTSGWRAPTLTPTGNGMLVASTASTNRHLYFGKRTGYGYQFNGVLPLPMAAIGASTEDHQAVVAPDCKTIYFAAVRSGGAGGIDLWAADVVSQ